MPKKVAYTRADGGVSVVSPNQEMVAALVADGVIEDEAVAAVCSSAMSDVEAGGSIVVDVDDLPAKAGSSPDEVEKRKRWKIEGGAVVVGA
jgi:hypothetical protein